MKSLYNIACVLLTMVPMLSFLTAAVTLVVRGHPYFGAVAMAFSILTVPGISLGGDEKWRGNGSESAKGGVKHGRTDRND